MTAKKDRARGFEITPMFKLRTLLPHKVYLAFLDWLIKSRIHSEGGGAGPDRDNPGFIWATKWYPARHEAKLRAWLDEHAPSESP